MTEREHFKINFNRRLNTCLCTHYKTYNHLHCERRNDLPKMSMSSCMEALAMLNGKEKLKLQMT